MSYPWEYVTKRGVGNLSNFKYDCHRGLAWHFFEPWFRFVAGCIPWWISPNVLSFSSWLSVFLTHANLWYKYSHGQVSPQDHILCAIGIFMFLTLDNVDGMHARATGQSSALGSFIDHGLDASTNLLLVITCAQVCVAYGPMQPDIPFALLPWVCYHYTHIFGHWLFYNTGTLHTSGLVELICLVMSIHVVVSIYGPLCASGQLTILTVSLVWLLQIWTIVKYFCMLFKHCGCTTKFVKTLRVLTPATMYTLSGCILVGWTEPGYELLPRTLVCTGLLVLKQQFIITGVTKDKLVSFQWWTVPTYFFVAFRVFDLNATFGWTTDFTFQIMSLVCGLHVFLAVATFTHAVWLISSSLKIPVLAATYVHPEKFADKSQDIAKED